MPKSYKIAVDFDGTCVDHRYPTVGKDAPHAVKVLKWLAAADHKLILYTMRSGEHLTDAITWFAEREIPLFGVGLDPDQASWSKSNKCYAHFYIDDAALGCPLIVVPGFQRLCVDWYAIEGLILAKFKAEDARKS